MKWAYLRELHNMDDDDYDDDDNDVPSTLIDSGGNEPKIIGYSDEIAYIRNVLLHADGVRNRIVSVVGIAGTGKTILAKQLYEDPLMLKFYKSRVWVSFGRQKYTFIEVAQRILAQLNPDSDDLVTQGKEKICMDLLDIEACVIVLDDVWDTGFFNELWVYLQGCRLLLTTRLQKVAQVASSVLKLPLWNKEESWHLFCAKMFAEELCPPELVIPGKKIVEKCEGLPLLEYWNKVAQDRRNRLLKDACKEIEEVLFPSYDHLPEHLKTCFLYMGVFPQDYEIPSSVIVNLWSAEGFLELNDNEKTSESCAMKCVYDLVSNNVLLVYQRTKGSNWKVDEEVKTCGLHTSFWHLSNREAEKNKFFHIFNNVEDGSEEGIKRHRRLCFHNNVLFGIKDVNNSIERVCAFTARSVLCFGSYHQYEVPICFGLRLLKVVDALAIRFYDFSLQVLKLVLLRYLALTCNGKLSPSINELMRLQFLIVGRHLSIKSNRAPSYMPMEIWDMQELQHLQIMGRDLLDPCGNLIPKLLKLIGVSAHSCTKEVFKGIPRVKKLGIQIELEPNATEPVYCFDHISNLNELESLKCVVVNPKFITPSSLQKLHLSGLDYPWEYMNIIGASSPNLEELYAFRGPEWEVQKDIFPSLLSLLIEDADLVQLKAAPGGFRCVAYIEL